MRVDAALTLLPMLRVGMHFVTLRVTAICDGSDACSRLESPFRPSATYFDGAKVGNPFRQPPPLVLPPPCAPSSVRHPG
ncbi:hypothetical protein DND90_22570 [Pseudomonas syringae pv. maculicola]|nr:hypothetical protein DND90_22570 [Pseudomonas syringae pv. maculicola]